jgi:DNA invertase Pin-like site-specific DNA recombinase
VEELDVSGGVAPEERRLERLLRRCEQGASQGILTWRVDRFSRSALDTLQAAKRLKECGARLVGVDDGVDTATAGGQLILTVLAGLAEEQRDRAREGWRVARAEASKRGVYLSGHAPTGYVRSVIGEKPDGSPEYGALVPDPGLAPVIREAFKRRAGGASFQAVADFLAEGGVLPRAGLRKDGVERTAWSREGARQLLRNPIYAGKPRGANSKAAIEAIVSPEEWRAAQIPVQVYPKGNGRTKALLTGLIRCGGCGHALHAAGPSPSYVCRGKFASGLCPARAVATVRRVDEYVLAQIEEHEFSAPEPTVSAETLWLTAQAAVEKAEAELDSWVEDATLRERLGEERFRRGLDARLAALEAAQRTLWDTPDPNIPADAFIVFSDQPTIYHALGDGIDADRRWVRRILASVVLHRANPAHRKHQPIGERVELRWIGEEAA